MLNQRFFNFTELLHFRSEHSGDYNPTGAVLFILQSHGLKPGILVVVINH